MRMETGVCVLHLFCSPGDHVDREAAKAAVKAAEASECQVVTAALLGHKGDLAVMALGVTRCGATATKTILDDFRARKAGGTPTAAAPTHDGEY